MKKTFTLLPILLCFLFVFSGCRNDVYRPVKTPVAVPAAPTGFNPDLPEITDTNVTEIKISDFAFNPSETTIKTGASVKWTNEDSTTHDIKSATFESPKLAPSQSYLRKFIETGTYEYSCGIHPSMTGKIIVE